MSHDKNDKGKSRFIVHYKRSMDDFKLDWNKHGFWGYWSGENHVDQKKKNYQHYMKLIGRHMM